MTKTRDYSNFHQKVRQLSNRQSGAQAQFIIRSQISPPPEKREDVDMLFRKEEALPFEAEETCPSEFTIYPSKAQPPVACPVPVTPTRPLTAAPVPPLLSVQKPTLLSRLFNLAPMALKKHKY
ncbi:MAG: hypothetical protein ABJN40_11685 [Sneathiella sp.]